MAWRLFLDSGVIVAGVRQPWGAAKAVLIHATERDRFTIVLAEAVQAELDDFLADLAHDVSVDEHARIAASLQGWLRRVRLERWPAPSPEALRAALPRLLPTLRHLNDLPVVVSAGQAAPDWVISDNEEHWSQPLAATTGLRIVTSRQFLRQMTLPPAPS
jgi:hypothetical protein